MQGHRGGPAQSPPWTSFKTNAGDNRSGRKEGGNKLIDGRRFPLCCGGPMEEREGMRFDDPRLSVCMRWRRAGVDRSSELAGRT